MIPSIAALIDASNGDLKLGTSDYRCLDTHWFDRHRGEQHPLVVIDEYGRIDGRCGARYVCDRCTTTHYCNAERGHAGDHRGRL